MSEFPFDDFKETDFNEFERFFKTNTVNPIYDHRANFQTNSPSFYEYLAKHNHLIKILAKRIYDYDKELAKRFEEWDKRIENLPEELQRMFLEWVDDGTLARILAQLMLEEYATKEEVNDLLEILSNEKITKLDNHLTVTVGENGDFQNVNDALKFLSSFRPLYQFDELKAEVLLLSGFIMKEQVHVKGINLSWITITSEDETVEYDRQAMILKDPDGYVSRTAFLGYNGGSLPSIKVLFMLNNTGDMTQTRFFQIRGGGSLYIHQYCGVDGKAERNLVVSHGSSVTARFSIIRNSGEINLRISNGGTFNGEYGDYSGSDSVNVAIACAIAGVDNSNVSNATHDGIRVTTGPAMVSANNLDATNCGRYGLHVWRGGDVNFTGSDVSNSGRNGILMEESGMVSAKNVKVDKINGIAIYLIGAVTLDISDGSVIDSSSTNIVLSNGARLNARKTTVTNVNNITSVSIVQGSYANLNESTLRGISVTSGSVVNINNCDCRKSTEISNSDITVDDGGIINATKSTGGTIISPNIIQPRGIIFKRDA